MPSYQRRYAATSGNAVRPCSTTLSATVTTTVVSTGSASGMPCSKAIRANTTVARPRGPNHPTNATVGHPAPVRARATATGIIRTTVRLSTAYAMTCQVISAHTWRTATAPKPIQVTAASRFPVSSVK